jgi:hypothetical protein
MSAIVILLMLVLAGPAWAGRPVVAPTYWCGVGPPPPGTSMIDAQCDLSTVTPDSQWFQWFEDRTGAVKVERMPCLELMQEAMILGDGYLQTFLSKEQRQESGLVLTPAGLKAFERMMKNWNRVAHACWREP